MGHGVLWFILLLFFSWTVIIIFVLMMQLNGERYLTISSADDNFNMILANRIKYHNLLAQLEDARRPQPVMININNRPQLIDDKDLRVRNERMKRAMAIRDAERMESLKDHKETTIAVLVLVCNRLSVLRCLDRLLLFRPCPKRFPIIVSQDCSHEETYNAIREYGDQVYYIHQPSKENRIPYTMKDRLYYGYLKISEHYVNALNHTFFNLGFDHVIIVEDDLDIASDFFEYFLGTLPILKKDPTIMCISAWNDNGKLGIINEDAPYLLHRTDFFPGLGWMLSKDIWRELSVKWPLVYWDDWVRRPKQRKGRACIRPEISRTRCFGKIGVSGFAFFDKFVKDIHLNTEYVSFTKLNLDYLLKEQYDKKFLEEVYRSPVVTSEKLLEDSEMFNNSVRITYNSTQSFASIAKSFRLTNDFRSGVPRTGYKGIVSFFYRNLNVFVTPPSNWTGYNPTWN